MMEGLHVFLFFQIPGKKGFKFHAQPQTGAYSCCIMYLVSAFVIAVLGSAFTVLLVSLVQTSLLVLAIAGVVIKP